MSSPLNQASRNFFACNMHILVHLFAMSHHAQYGTYNAQPPTLQGLRSRSRSRSRSRWALYYIIMHSMVLIIHSLSLFKALHDLYYPYLGIHMHVYIYIYIYIYIHVLRMCVYVSVIHIMYNTTSNTHTLSLSFSRSSILHHYAQCAT